MDRREFLKGLTGAAVVGAAMAAGCDNPNSKSAEGFAEGDIPTDKMTYRLDAHGQPVSLLGFGMMRLPAEGGGTGRENPQAPIDQEEVNRQVDYAIEHGVNYFDTSPVYCQGRSETCTGIALSRHPRNKWLIATKMSNHRLAGQGLSPQEIYRKSVEMYRKSFVDLQVDYIDYYLLHSIGGGASYGSNTIDGMPVLRERFLDSGVLDFLVAEREAGRIRNLGWSFHGDVKVFDHMLQLHDEGKYHWDFVQIQMNYVDWRYAHEINAFNINGDYLYAELDKRGIPAVIMEPLLGGRLATLNDHAASQLKEREPNKSLASWAFRWLGTYPRVLTSLSGMTYMEHLQDNLRTHSPLKPLDESEMSLLERIAEEFAHYPAIPCTACQYCMPCPYGLDIPGIFGHYNKCLNEGNIAIETQQGSSQEQREYRRARKAFLTSYDKSIARLRQADHCIECGECLKHCPQSIDIPMQMHKIEQYTNQLKDSMV